MSVIEAGMQPAVEMVQLELSTAEHADLLRYEAVIRRGLETFLDVGRALMAIRDEKLYRATHGTFEDYCREQWNISRKYAYRQINAAMVVGNLEMSPIGDILPANEAQARPLTKLEPDQQREAWTEAVESVPDGKPTAAAVTKAAAKFAEPKPVPPPREIKRIRDETRKPEPTPATAVYVEPSPTPDDEEAAAIAEVAAERAEEDAERLAREAQRAEDERIEDEDDHYTARGGILSRTWIMDTLISDDPAHAYYASALSGATADDLREALASLSTEDKHYAARLDALMGALDVLEPPALVTVTLPLELAQKLHGAAARLDIRCLTLVEQSALEDILTSALGEAVAA